MVLLKQLKSDTLIARIKAFVSYYGHLSDLKGVALTPTLTCFRTRTIDGDFLRFALRKAQVVDTSNCASDM